MLVLDHYLSVHSGEQSIEAKNPEIPHRSHGPINLRAMLNAVGKQNRQRPREIGPFWVWQNCSQHVTIIPCYGWDPSKQSVSIIIQIK